ncbi:MAG TPA: methionine--tRNA ligase subunit beta [Clostridiales bacterium]|nr:methionine--tRNA ligase subunit beta [Clostridiales bacterium]
MTKMDSLKVSDSMDEIFKLLRRSNKYIDETTPWILGKDENKKDRLATVLYNLLESIRFAAVMLSPYLPETTEKIFRQINSDLTTWESLKTFNGTIVGGKVNKPEILFGRIDTKKKLMELSGEKEEPKAEDKKTEIAKDKNAKAEISIDDFAKLDLRLAEIVTCKPHPDADRLLVLQLKVGDEKRQVVSGIAKWYKPEELIGKKVVMVYNLAPVELRGIESQGMVLAASKGKKLSLVSTLEDLKDGSIIT